MHKFINVISERIELFQQLYSYFEISKWGIVYFRVHVFTMGTVEPIKGTNGIQLVSATSDMVLKVKSDVRDIYCD